MKNPILSASVFLCLLFTSFYNFGQVPTVVLVGFYPFNGNANDLSGNSNNGTVSGATLTTDRFGNPNSAYYFDGVNDYIVLPAPPFLLNNYTFSGWVRPNGATSNSAFIFCAGDISFGQCQSVVYLPASQILGGSYNTGGSPIQSVNFSSSTFIPANAWSHVVVTRNNSLIQVYINGTLSPAPASATIAGQNADYGPNSSNVVLGARSNFVSTGFFAGRIDDIRYYNSVLTASQVTQLYNELACYATLSITPNPYASICAGNAATLTAVGNATTPISWYSSPTSTVPVSTSTVLTTSNFTSPGIYSYFIEVPTCTIYPRVQLNVIVNPTPTIAVNNGSVCAGNGFSIIPSGAYSYTFSTGSSTFVPSSTTIYTVAGTSSAGCISSVTGTVQVLPVPALAINGNSNVCAGSTVTLSASGASSYLWNGSVSGSTFMVTPNANTVCVVSAVGSNGCSAAISKSISVSPLPVVAIQGNSLQCQDMPAAYSATGTAQSYSWCTGTMTNQLVYAPPANTVITVTGISSAGCVSSASFQIMIKNKPVILIIASSSSLCVGAPLLLGASGAVTFTWNNGIIMNSAFYPTLTNTYVVSGTGQNGCISSSSIQVIVNALPLITVSGLPQTICKGETIILAGSGGNFYSWSNGLNTPTIQLSPVNTGTFEVTGTDNNGCTSSSIFLLNVSQCTQIAGTEGDNLIIYPQPFTDKVTITGLENPDRAFYMIFNSAGLLISTGQMHENSTIDLRDQAPGIYLLQLFINENVQVHKKIIKSN
jgi:hypothetical protein